MALVAGVPKDLNVEDSDTTEVNNNNQPNSIIKLRIARSMDE